MVDQAITELTAGGRNPPVTKDALAGRLEATGSALAGKHPLGTERLIVRSRERSCTFTDPLLAQPLSRRQDRPSASALVALPVAGQPPRQRNQAPRRLAITTTTTTTVVVGTESLAVLPVPMARRRPRLAHGRR